MSTTKNLRPASGYLDLAIEMMVHRYGRTQFDAGHAAADLDFVAYDRLHRVAARQMRAILRLTAALAQAQRSAR